MNAETIERKTLPKRLLALFLALAVAVATAVSVAPGTAFAVDYIYDYDGLKTACEEGSGTYTLYCRITYPGDQCPSVDYAITIDLAGNEISADRASDGFVVTGSLTIEDSGTGGKITAPTGVYVSGGTFTLESGTIAAGPYGVYVSKGVAEIKGGAIVDYVTMESGVHVAGSDATLKLSGAPYIASGYEAGIVLEGSNPLVIAGQLSHTTPISVDWYPSPGVHTGVFTSGYSDYCGETDPSTYFTAARSGYMVVRDGDEAAIAKAYTVTFENDDGAELQSGRVAEGASPKYAGEAPAKDPTAQHTYTFTGWTDGTNDYAPDAALPAVTGDVTYTATYSEAPRKYEVTFKNDDEAGTVLQTGQVAYGQTPEYEGDGPTKPATAQYTYKFKGWSPEIAPVTGDVAYTATYTEAVNEYAVRFVDEDGTELQSSKLAYGETPKYTGVEPAKPATAQYTYEFKGCDPEIAARYIGRAPVATYNSTVNEYIITFVDDDGTELQSGKVAYGENPEYTGAEPTKPATAQYTYEFKGWDPKIAEVAGDATYKATYEATPVPAKKATLTFDLGGGTLDGKTGKITVEANVGDTVKLPGAPTKDGYTFKCWKGSEYAAGADYKVEGDHSFTAEWEKNAGSGTAATAKAATPKTGDGNGMPVAGLLTAALLALCVIAAYVVRRRRDS